MPPVPPSVAELGLGYEFMRVRWLSEDEERSIWKRRVALAMLNEIKRAARRRRMQRTRKIRWKVDEVRRRLKEVDHFLDRTVGSEQPE
jgi:hypothetical protein